MRGGVMRGGMRGGMGQQQSRPGGAPRALMDLAFGIQRSETWFDQPQPGPSKKPNAALDEEVEMYYHEELMEKLVNIKGVSSFITIIIPNIWTHRLEQKSGP